MIFLNLSNKDLLVHIMGTHCVFTEIENQGSVCCNLMWNFSWESCFIIWNPNKQFWAHAFQKTKFLHSVFEWLSPMFAFIEHLDGWFNLFLDPINHLMINFILFFLFLFSNHLKVGLGSIESFSFPLNGIVEVFTALDLIGLILFFLALHLFDQLLVLLFRDLLVLVNFRFFWVGAREW